MYLPKASTREGYDKVNFFKAEFNRLEFSSTRYCKKFKEHNLPYFTYNRKGNR